MNNKNEIKENISKGEIIRTYCNKCRQDMNHQVLMDYCESGTVILNSDYDFIHGKVDYTADFRNDYQIIRCSGCSTISYRNYNYFSEYRDVNNNGTWEERFPVIKRRMEKKYKYLPSTFTRIYNEVIMAYNNDSFLLCAAGIRAVLEGICKDKGITDSKLNLFNKIIKMCEQGFVSKQHESTLHKLRFLGNEALHELQEPTQEEIDAALDIIEHIIESLYEIVGKAEILRTEK